MSQYELQFWYKSMPKEKEFIEDKEQFITTAFVTETYDNNNIYFKIKLSDIGLLSKYGEFVITKSKDFWTISDIDGSELNHLKGLIIEALELSSKQL